MARTTYFNVRVLAVVAALALAACLLALVVRGEPSQAAFPGQNGKIAFISDRDGARNEIYTMNADGTNPTRLTNNETQDRSPTFSADGKKIAFSRENDPGLEDDNIWVMNADGSGQTDLNNPDVFSRDLAPSFSPDGSKIAFSRVLFEGEPPFNNDIWVMNADGTGQTNLSNSPASEDYMPAFSPDGSKIAFISNRDSALTEIYTMNADGTNPTRLTNNLGSVGSFSFSPDGSKIAFETHRDGAPEIYVMNADGSGTPTNLSNNPGSSSDSTAYDRHPAWSPDGTHIAFESLRSGNSDIYVMSANGSNQINVSNNAATDDYPAWQPLPPDTAPTITNLRPAPGSTTTNRTPTIAATVTDQQTNLAKSNITLTLDGATISQTAYSYNQSTDTMSYTPQKKLMLGQHTVKVDAQDGSGLSTTKSWTFTTAAAGAAVQGLKGEYFDNQDLTSLKLTRTDPKIDFAWGTGSPDPSIAPDTFSVRWSGQIKADNTETYTFYTTTNDGARLWVNGQQIINRWSDGALTNTGTVTLQAGQWYPITMEYYEGINTASAKLEYSSPSTPRQVIPSSKLSPTAP